MSTDHPTEHEVPPMVSGEEMDRYLQNEGRVRTLTDDEWYHEVFEPQALKLFGMSGEEFRRAYFSGELNDHPDHGHVTYVAMLMPQEYYVDR